MNLSFSDYLDFSAESPLCNFQNSKVYLPDYPTLLNDEKVASSNLRPISPPLMLLNGPKNCERSTSLNFRESKLLDIPKSEPLITRTNHFITKDDYLWKDFKELPDVILSSPRKENTPDRNFKSILDFGDEKDNLNFDFDNTLKNVLNENEVSVCLENFSAKEFLEYLWAKSPDQLFHQFDQDLLSLTSSNEKDPTTFNEISCNINKEDVVIDSKSVIKTLLKDDSFKGNFEMKKSTEILSAGGKALFTPSRCRSSARNKHFPPSTKKNFVQKSRVKAIYDDYEIDHSHDCFAEHNYFSPKNASKPSSTNTDFATPHDTIECVVSCALPPAHVPTRAEDFVAGNEISTTSSNSSNQKAPQTTIPSQCATRANSPSSMSAAKPVKCKSRDVAKKVNKKPSTRKTDPDPTYTPNVKRPRPAKKSSAAKNTTNANQSKTVAPVTKFNTGGMAQPPRIPPKPASGAELKTFESGGVVKSRLPRIPLKSANGAEPKAFENRRVVKPEQPRVPTKPARDAQPKLFEFESGSIEKSRQPRKPPKPATGAKSKTTESDNLVKSRLPPAIAVPKVVPRVPATSSYVGTLPEIESGSAAKSQQPRIPSKPASGAQPKLFESGGIEKPQQPRIPSKPAAGAKPKLIESDNPAKSQIPPKVVPRVPATSSYVGTLPEIESGSAAKSQQPRIPSKPAAGAKPKLIESDNLAKSQIPPKVVPRVPATSTFVDALDPVRVVGSSAPLASPTRDDVLNDDFTTKDSCQPETVNSNVEETKKTKKKLSWQEYRQKRAAESKNVPDKLDDPDPIESITVVPLPNVEEILKSIIANVPKTIATPKPSPVVKTELANVVAPTKPVTKSAPVPAISTPVVKSQPVPKPSIPSNNCEPIRQRDEVGAKKPMANLRVSSSTVPKSLTEPVNDAPLKLIKLANPNKTSAAQLCSPSPNGSCDRYSSSGVSSYQNSSVSSTCGSPFAVLEDKRNNTKYSNRDKIATSKQQLVKMPKIPFAVDEELLRRNDLSSKKNEHRRKEDRHSITRKRKASDSCFEDDSDRSDSSDRKRSRRRYSSSSSSSSNKSHYYRSHNVEYATAPRTYHEWQHSAQKIISAPYGYDYNGVPIPNNMYITPPPPWHPVPDIAYSYPVYQQNVELPPYYFSGRPELGMDICGEVEDRRTLFVGNIGKEVTEQDLLMRFKKFGDIRKTKIIRRDNHSRQSLGYGFVQYRDEKYVQKAIKHGNDDPNLPPVRLSVGIRRERYPADRHVFAYGNTTPLTTFHQTPCSQDREESYSWRLEQMKNDLKQKKLSGRLK